VSTQEMEHEMTPDEMSVLLEQAADGDPAAWKTIVEKYSALLWSVVRRFRLGEAQSADAVQLTWLRLVENIHRIRDPKRLAGWLRVTAHRICVDLIRQSAHEKPVDRYQDQANSRLAVGYDLGNDEPAEALLRREREALVRRAVGRLPEKQRELLVLLVASPPLNYEEISDRLGIPVGSIGPTRGRILKRLRMELRADDFQDLSLG
jgi:RNA polymerase sigma factor (sigma-70 family)